MAVKNVKRDPMKTKTGKIRLGPLNLKQLQDMLGSCRPKHKMMIQRRIVKLEKEKINASQS